VALEFILRKTRRVMVNGTLFYSLQLSVKCRCGKTKGAGDTRGRKIVQRKVFRVEQMFSGDRAAAAEPRPMVDELKTLRALTERRDSSDASAEQDLKRELALIHDTIARNKRELGQLLSDGKERRIARAADELRASVDGMDRATQKILGSVEIIDDSARALASALKNGYERGLTQDIQDHVVKIYEICNFQDLAGQRISNVIGIMTMIEDRIAALLDGCGCADARPAPLAMAKPASERGLLNGPKLDGDTGHASQHDIDKMFG
jgi:chemotaxis protein CheZ